MHVYSIIVVISSLIGGTLIGWVLCIEDIYKSKNISFFLHFCFRCSINAMPESIDSAAASTEKFLQNLNHSSSRTSEDSLKFFGKVYLFTYILLHHIDPLCFHLSISV